MRGHWMTALTGWDPLQHEQEDLECPLLLEPHLQELLGGEDPVSAKAPYDPKPSPLHQTDWIQWHASQVEMLTWWKELQEVPGNNDCWEFAHKVHTSFGVPKACNWAKGIENDHCFSTSTSFPREAQVHAAPQLKVQQPRLLTYPAMPDPCICQGTPVLGREGPATNPQWTALSGGECGRAAVGRWWSH